MPHLMLGEVSLHTSLYRRVMNLLADLECTVRPCWPLTRHFDGIFQKLVDHENI